MKASILKMRMAVVAAFITLCAATAVAQTARKHVIERGETLESIATRYGVTTEEIIKLNPGAAQFVYVGMELTLPEKPVETAAGDTAVPEKTLSEPSATAYQYGESVNPVTDGGKLTPNDFAMVGASYFAPFEQADLGYYMVGYTILSSAGWGANFHIGANYGLVDSDFAGVAFLAGPAYGYAYKNFLFGASFDFLGTYLGQGSGEDLKFNWGFSLMPKAVVKFGKVQPWVGVNASWVKGADKLTVGFQVGIGFNV